MHSVEHVTNVTVYTPMSTQVKMCMLTISQHLKVPMMHCSIKEL